MEKVFPEALQSLKSADPLIYKLIQKEKKEELTTKRYQRNDNIRYK